MENSIQLEPNVLIVEKELGDNWYILFKGQASEKDIGNGKNEEITPLSLIEIKNPLNADTSKKLYANFEHGYIHNNHVHTPNAVRISFDEQHIKMQDKGELCILTSESDGIIRGYRTLGLLENMSKWNVSNISNCRDAYDILSYGQRKLSESVFGSMGPKLKKESTRFKDKLMSLLGYEPKSIESVEDYKGVINPNKLYDILHSFPIDSNGRTILPNQKVDLIFSKSKISPKDLENKIRDKKIA